MTIKIPTIDEIQLAAEHLKDVIIRTPTIRSPWLSSLINGDVYLKLETLQITGSFKPRGAYIKMISLSKEQRKKGIIAMSAGNHAQGVAYFAQKLKIPATIVMPVNTPEAKISRTRDFGAHVILEGADLRESGIAAMLIADKKDLTLIHPYDDLEIIKGQGTVGLEMLADANLDDIIVPIGGGGLASGICIAAHALSPSIRVYGVQSTYCPAMIKKLYPNRLIPTSSTDTIPLAEGIAVKSPGEITSRILKKMLYDMIAVSDDDIELAMDTLMIKNKLVTEGAGAAGVAALLQNMEEFRGRRVGIVLCGANVDSRILSSVLLRGLIHTRKMVSLQVQILDGPGALGKLTNLIGSSGGNIFELSHQRLFHHLNVKMVEVNVVIETHGSEHLQNIVKMLQVNSIPVKIID